MVQLLDADIRTREVVSWKGIHVFHDPGSSCSQKLRIFLNLKGIEWESHPIDVLGKENIGEYYLGVNPRGLVPALVHDGQVHIESNDILLHLERAYPDPPLVPLGDAETIEALLRHEDELHLDLRTVSFTFLIPPEGPPKSAEDLSSYASRGSGTVRGHEDEGKQREIAFWRQFLGDGISDAAVCRSVARFADEFYRLDKTLEQCRYLSGESLTVLDIAWMVYVNRLVLCGYPLARHRHLARWAEGLWRCPEFSRELMLPRFVAEVVKTRQAAADALGRSMAQLCNI